MGLVIELYHWKLSYVDIEPYVLVLNNQGPNLNHAKGYAIQMLIFNT
jgi:hypothetical protein